MSTRSPHTPRILELATKVQQDIVDRNLKPGDPYLKTTEIARMLGVSTSTANRAMQLLQKRRILHRSQRSSPIVAEGIMTTDSSMPKVVHFLVPETYLKTEGLLGDGMMIGMQTELRGINVQLNFIDPSNEIEEVNRLITNSLRSREPEGFVLIRSSLQVQRLVQASGLPAVVLGMLYPTVRGLARINRDEYASGQLLADYVLSQGHQRILYLSRDRLFAGEHPFEEGIRDALMERQAKLSNMVTLHLPDDFEEIRSAVKRIIEKTDEPLGIIARSEPLAKGAAAAVEDAGLCVGSDTTIAVAYLYRSGIDKKISFPYVRNLMDAQEIGSHVAKMLLQQVHGAAPCPDHKIIPFEIANTDV